LKISRRTKIHWKSCWSKEKDRLDEITATNSVHHSVL
jgi:hypothetical protein